MRYRSHIRALSALALGLGASVLLGLLAACSQPAGNPASAGFSLTLEPAQLTASAGGSIHARLRVNSERGFAGTVALSLRGRDGGQAPAGISLAQPASVRVPGGPYDAVFSVAQTVSAGTYQLTLLGVSGGVSSKSNLTLVVTGAAPDFQASLSSNTPSTEPGGSVSLTLTVNPQNGFNGNLALSLVDSNDDPVSGFTLSPTSVTVNGEVQQAITIQVASTVAVSSYPLKIKLAGGGTTHYLGLDLMVKGVALSLASSHLYAAQGETTAAFLRVDAVGVSGDLSLSLESADGSAAPSGLSLAPSSVTVPGGPYELTLAVGAGVATGSYDLRLRAELEGTIQTLGFTLVVQPPPEFTAQMDSDTMSVEVGETDSNYLKLDFQSDFNGDIALSLESGDGSPPPDGVSISPSAISMAASAGDQQYVSLTVAVSTDAAAGTYPLRVRVSSTNTTRYAAFTLTVPQPPDFTLSLSDTSLELVRGGQAAVQLDVTPYNGFAGTVNLSLAGQNGAAVPSGVSLSPTSVDLSGGAASVTLTLSAADGVAVDRYYLQVVGSSGDTTQAADLSLEVQDFALDLGTSPPTVLVDQGGSGSLALTVNVSVPNSYSTFVGPIQLSLTSSDGTPLPDVSLSPTTLDVSPGSNNVTVTLSADASAATGSYDLVLVGAAAGVTRSAEFTLDLRGFSLALSAAELGFWTGGSGSLDLTVTPGGGFDDTVSLSLVDTSGNPAPSGLSLSPTSLAVSGSTTQTLTVTADATVAAGEYPLRVKAVSGTIVHYADFTLKIEDFSVVADADSLEVWQNDTGDLGLTVTPAGGFSGAVGVYLIPGNSTLPSGVTLSPGSFNVAGTTSQTLGLTAADAATPGSFDLQIEVRASLNGVSRSRYLPLTLGVKGFLVSLDQSNFYVARGGNASRTLTVTSYGVNDDLTLALNSQDGAGLPAGVTYAPASMTASDGSVTGTLTIGTDASTGYGSPADYPLTLTVSFGSLAHPIDLDLLVYRETEFWTPQDAGTNYDLRSVAYGNGTFVAVGGGQASQNASGYGIAAVSSDGHSWTASGSITNNELHAVAYGDGVFVAAGEACEVASYDGSSWTQRASADALCSVRLGGAAYGDGVFVLVGEAGAVFRSSDDGVSWNQVTDLPSGTGDLYGVTYTGGGFVAVGAGGTVLTSTDGTSWTAQTSATSADLTAVAYGDGTYVAVGKGGVVLTSSDGQSWSAGSLGTSLDATGVTYGYDRDGVGIFVVTVNSSNNGVYTSDDAGSSWQQQNSGGAGSAPLAAAYGNNTFVIVGYDGAVASSP